MIKRGVRATDAKRIFGELAIGQGTALKALNISPATINKKAKQDQILSPEESERVIGIARLVGQLEEMVEEFNILINPAHPESAGVRAVKKRKWLYDPRHLR